MEGQVREMNLADVAERVEKILMEAAHIRQRLENIGDALRGDNETRPSEGATPHPSGLIPLIAYRLETIESIQNAQRQELNRLQGALCEAPAAAQLSAGNQAQNHAGQTLGRRY